MRVPAAVLATMLAAPLLGADSQRADAPAKPGVTATPPAHCQRTTSYLANGSSEFNGQPLKPQKLSELPPATGYMAVYRHIDGCEAPMTAVEYRNGGSR